MTFNARIEKEKCLKLERRDETQCNKITVDLITLGATMNCLLLFPQQIATLAKRALYQRKHILLAISSRK
jgi:hypothetical protein